MLRLLTCFVLGAALVVLWSVIKTTGIWTPGATRTEQTLVEPAGRLDPAAGLWGEDASPADESVSQAQAAPPASGAPSEALEPAVRSPVSPPPASAGREEVREAERTTAETEAEAGARSDWMLPLDEPSLDEVVRPPAGYRPGAAAALPPPDPPRSPRGPVSERDRSQRLDVEALLDTYLEALRQLERESR